MNDPRRYYEAVVVLVPLGATAHQVVADMATAGLAGVSRLELLGGTNGQAGRHRLVELGAVAGPAPSGEAATLEQLVDGADVVVLIGASLDEVEPTFAAEVASAARDAGDLVAGVIVQPQVGPTGDALDVEGDAARGRAVLREQVDVLVSTRGRDSARAFIDVVRGGRRDDHSPAG